jgi:cytochrome c
MKCILIVAAASAALTVLALPAQAQEDKAKAAGCPACHEVDKKKVGPSFKSVAEKYKGKDGAADTLVGKLTKGHGGKKPSADDAKAIVDWILGMA